MGEHSAENEIAKTRPRIRSRYDKLAANYLALVNLASIRIWLHANEFTPGCPYFPKPRTDVAAM
jgi:hypothetical protein